MSDFQRKAQNIWYHYKFHILVGLFLLVTILICLYSCATKPQFDIQVYYVSGSSRIYNEQLDWLEAAVAKHCGDTNGDGEITVAVTGLKVGKNTDPSMRAQYMNAVHAGEVMLLFGDAEGISYLYQNGFLQPLTDFSDELDGDGYAWVVSDSAFSQQTEGFELFDGSNVYISLRIFEETWASALGSAKDNYKIACDTLRSMIALDAPEGEE